MVDWLRQATSQQTKQRYSDHSIHREWTESQECILYCMYWHLYPSDWEKLWHLHSKVFHHWGALQQWCQAQRVRATGSHDPQSNWATESHDIGKLTCDVRRILHGTSNRFQTLKRTHTRVANTRSALDEGQPGQGLATKKATLWQKRCASDSTKCVQCTYHHLLPWNRDLWQHSTTALQLLLFSFVNLVLSPVHGTAQGPELYSFKA